MNGSPTAMTPAQRAEANARLDALAKEIRDLSRQLDAVVQALAGRKVTVRDMADAMAMPDATRLRSRQRVGVTRGRARLTGRLPSGKDGE
jgi:small-conductance mechanosensitive channel